jgi:hypothetical protein
MRARCFVTAAVERFVRDEVTVEDYSQKIIYLKKNI